MILYVHIFYLVSKFSYPYIAVSYTVLCKAYEVPRHNVRYFCLTYNLTHTQTFLLGPQGNLPWNKPSTRLIEHLVTVRKSDLIFFTLE